MQFIEAKREGDVAVLTIQRGKVNALNGSVVRELRARLDELSGDGKVLAIVITGRGKFFSFGLDVPELYGLSREEFTRFVEEFTGLYAAIYVCPKPVIAALNGHAIAGGCMLALACDRRLMAEGKGRIGLNEVTFGSSVFAGSVEMLRALVGERNAEKVLLSGTMFDGGAALDLGLVDRIVPAGGLLAAALDEAADMMRGDSVGFAEIKALLRGPIAEAMRSVEDDSIRKFVRVWYSENTREKLKAIEIRNE